MSNYSSSFDSVDSKLTDRKTSEQKTPPPPKKKKERKKENNSSAHVCE